MAVGLSTVRKLDSYTFNPKTRNESLQQDIIVAIKKNLLQENNIPTRNQFLHKEIISCRKNSILVTKNQYCTNKSILATRNLIF